MRVSLAHVLVCAPWSESPPDSNRDLAWRCRDAEIIPGEEGYLFDRPSPYTTLQTLTLTLIHQNDEPIYPPENKFRKHGVVFIHLSLETGL